MWHDKDGKKLHPHTNYYVGGNTKFWRRAVPSQEGRFPVRFVIMAASLRPGRFVTKKYSYYTEAERLYHVHGNRGEDPAEPPASAPYPHPAVSHEPRINNYLMTLPARACSRFTPAGRHAQ